MVMLAVGDALFLFFLNFFLVAIFNVQSEGFAFGSKWLSQAGFI